MPVIGIKAKSIKNLLKKEITTSELINICDNLGYDIEEYVEEKSFKCKECSSLISINNLAEQPIICSNCKHPINNINTSEIIVEELLRFNLLPNRPDNFDSSGIARAINSYLGLSKELKEYNSKSSDYNLVIDPSISLTAPSMKHISCAVIKGITFNEEDFLELMKLQENLHWALGRNRKHASIGIYELNSISKNIIYKSIEKNSIKFSPLTIDLNKNYVDMTPDEILSVHPKGIEYAHLLNGYNYYPLLIDDKGTVLSMPPIINSDKTKVTQSTKDLLIDVTGTSEFIVSKTINIILASLKDRFPNSSIFSVNISSLEKKYTTPDTSTSVFEMNFQRCRNLIGNELSDNVIIECLERMGFRARKNEDICMIDVPCYRTDIMHEYDIIEDVAIAYGYNNLKEQIISTYSIGERHPEEIVKQKIREIMVAMNFLEVMNIMLTSKEKSAVFIEKNFSKFVTIENPKSVDQSVVRAELLSGLLETLSNNVDNELPQKIFEIGDKAVIDQSSENGVDEIITLAATMVNSKIGFSDIKQIIKTLFYEMDISWGVREVYTSYYIKGRSAEIICNDKVIGHFGEINPVVLEYYHISNPIVAFEINLSAII